MKLRCTKLTNGQSPFGLALFIAALGKLDFPIQSDFLKCNILSKNTNEINKRRLYFDLIWTAVSWERIFLTSII